MPSLYSPAAERNAGPILQVLQALREPLPATGNALEIASGSGQHAAVIAAALPGWHWQPSDWQSEAFASITEWAQETGATNVLGPVLLDVRSPHWPAQSEPFGRIFDLIFCANMLHIAPWECCAGLMQGAARHLRADGQLFIYGPFLERDVPTAHSNAGFDASLRLRDPSWGLRALDDVLREAASAGLELRTRLNMPANNLWLQFGHRDALARPELSLGAQAEAATPSAISPGPSPA